MRGCRVKRKKFRLVVGFGGTMRAVVRFGPNSLGAPKMKRELKMKREFECPSSDTT
jgi:hypothetical protein